LASQEAALNLRKQLVEEYPNAPEYARDLADSYAARGELEELFRDAKDALASYETSRNMRERLVRDYPGAVQFTLDLADTYHTIAALERKLGHPPEALASLEAARAVEERVIKQHDDVPDYAATLAGTHVSLGILHVGLGKSEDARKSFGAALENFDRAIAMDGGRNPRYRLQRADALLHSGAYAQAAAAAEEVALLKDLPGRTIYNSACVYSRCVAAVEKDDHLSAAPRAELAETYSTRATSLLRQASQAGFSDLSRLKQDPDLDPLRSRAAFTRLLAELEKQPSTTPSTTPIRN
jgi:tetratricopeptide (TPR) repeat protein